MLQLHVKDLLRWPSSSYSQHPPILPLPFYDLHSLTQSHLLPVYPRLHLLHHPPPPLLLLRQEFSIAQLQPHVGSTCFCEGSGKLLDAFSVAFHLLRPPLHFPHRSHPLSAPHHLRLRLLHFFPFRPLESPILRVLLWQISGLDDETVATQNSGSFSAWATR